MQKEIITISHIQLLQDILLELKKLTSLLEYKKAQDIIVTLPQKTIQPPYIVSCSNTYSNGKKN